MSETDAEIRETHADLLVRGMNEANRDALLDALLREKGYEKRLAENDSGRVYYVAPKDDIAEEVHTTPIYVPLQREEPE